MDARESAVVALIKERLDEGAYDPWLDELSDAFLTRVKKRDEFRDYPPGTRIKLRNLRPEYLVGAEGVVVRRKVKNYVIHLDADHGKFRAGRDLVVRPTMLSPA